MSRYRKIEVKTWGDEKFQSLSPIPPCAQGLWLYLLTCPFTSPIPGLFKAGRAAMAEDLGWSLEAFDEAFAEVFAKGMVKADWKARVVWVPKAIKHNRPESPNVVSSWGKEIDLIPECELKNEAVASLGEFMQVLDSESKNQTNWAFSKAFSKAFGKAFGKASPKTMANQEQEQEQEQELFIEPYGSMSGSRSANADVARSPPEKKTNGLKANAVVLLNLLNDKTGRHYRPTDTTLKPIIARLREGYSLIECKGVVIRKWRQWGSDDKMRDYLRPETLFGATKFAQYVGEVPPPENPQPELDGVSHAS